jgi:hypothetical protein
VRPSQFNLYVYIKLLIWAFLGGAIVLPYKVKNSAKALMFFVPLLMAVAAYIGLYGLMRITG